MVLNVLKVILLLLLYKKEKILKIVQKENWICFTFPSKIFVVLQKWSFYENSKYKKQPFLEIQFPLSSHFLSSVHILENFCKHLSVNMLSASPCWYNHCYCNFMQIGWSLYYTIKHNLKWYCITQQKM